MIIIATLSKGSPHDQKNNLIFVNEKNSEAVFDKFDELRLNKVNQKNK